MSNENKAAHAAPADTSGSDETQSDKVDERALREILKITYEVGPPAGSEYFTIRELCRAALAQQAASPAPVAAHADERCPHCDGTGDVHTPTGEWRGACTCPAGEVHAQQDAALDIPSGPLDANELEKIAKSHPDKYFLKGSGVLKLLGAIRTLEQSAAAPGKADAANAGGLIVEQVVESAERHEFNDHETGKRDFDRLGFAQEIYAIGRGHAMRDYINPATSAADAKDAERYRWLVANARTGIGFGDWWINADEPATEWDAAIDAAIAASRKGGA